MKAIEGLPRTLAAMPVMHNFGHVAVSGCCFWRHAAGQQFMVTLFNTGRVVRMELTPEGSTYKATENEFLQLADSDVHLTDVIEDKDGSLLMIDTGGWFRIGCPASLMAKPDVLGAVYRVRGPAAQPVAVALPPEHQMRKNCESIATSPAVGKDIKQAVIAMLAKPMDAALEHAAMHAVIKQGWKVRDLFDHAENDAHRRRLLHLGADENDEPAGWAISAADKCLGSDDARGMIR
jgi:hypothetical protein